MNGSTDTPDLGTMSFYTEHLLSKFGFGDGDMLYDLIEEHELGVDHQDLLIAVVERLLVSRLDHVVETYTLGSMHNPIRARTVDGEPASESWISPAVVEIPISEIIAVARTLPPLEDEEW